MRLLQICSLRALIVFAATAASAQAPPLAISRVDANPARLSCSGGASEAVVTVQVWFDQHDSRVSGREVAIGLQGFKATPPTNSLRIIDTEQDVLLEESPAVAKFRVACGSATVPGEVVLFATLGNLPSGIDIASHTFDPASQVTIKVGGAGK